MGKISPPLKYRVVLESDPNMADLFSPILTRIFRKSREEVEVHKTDLQGAGKTVVGVYPWEVAETKILEANGVLEGGFCRKVYFTGRQIKPF